MMRVIATLLLFAAVAGCGGEPGTEPGDGFVTAPVSLDLSGITDIGKVAVEITGPGIASPIIVNLTVSNGTASGTLTIPTGTERTITVRVYDTGGTETHRGAVTLTIVEGTTPTVAITLQPLMGEVPITALIGVYVVTVTPSADTVFVGDTVRLAAEVRDGAGILIAVAVTWASTNPGRASVDSAGVVTGLAPGDVRVAATYQGSTDDAQLLVYPAPSTHHVRRQRVDGR